MEEICGIVNKIIYTNDENAYTVLDISLKNEENITLVGYIPYVCVGEEIKATGEIKTHKQYGQQFIIDKYELTLPNDTENIYNYLKGGAFKGIGEITAKRIVDKFGSEVFNIIDKDSEKLLKISGMTKAKVSSMVKQYRDSFGIRQVIKDLSAFGIPPFKAARVYRRFGISAVAFINKNPYLLCDELFDISFEQADALAKKLGIEAEAQCRLVAGVEYVLKHNLNNGHTFLPYEALAAVSAKLLSIDTDTMCGVMEQMKIDKTIAQTQIANINAVYLHRYFDCESYIAQRLLIMAQNIYKNDFTDEINKMEKELKIEYAPLQKRAIQKAAQNGVFILTGGPGTGKTTALVGMIMLFERMGKKCMLAAPTGRAAKRMSAVTDREAKTIHRLLETVKADGMSCVFGRDEKNPIDADAIIIDETSMVEATIFEALLRATKPTAQLILVGDADQLPPVGAGNVLKDMIKSDLFASVELTEIFRQARDSLIVVNAHLINSGEYPECNSVESDFYFVKRADKDAIEATLLQLVTVSLQKKFGLNPMSDIQVLSPTRKGQIGTVNLNNILQQKLNPPSKNKVEYTYFDTVFRVGDKVMQNKNNYETMWIKKDTGEVGDGIYNGDIGIITHIDLYAKQLTVDFDGRIAEIVFDNLNELELAYAITVHKSQGNEFPCVVMPVYYGAGRLSTRNLLYTAVTRAKNIMVLVGEQGAVYKMVDNNSESKRYTGLKYIMYGINEEK